MATVYHPTGSVTKKMIVWIGVTRLIVRARKLSRVQVMQRSLRLLVLVQTTSKLKLLMFPAITVNFVRCQDGLCIPVSWTCDEQPDCRHGDDEDKKLCGKEEECDGFACGTDSCIPHRYAWSMSLRSKAEIVQ